MANNFDFLKNIDSELFEIIDDAQNLFCDEYFNQSVIQVRIFAEKLASRIINKTQEMTFDDVLNCFKDRVKTEREKEFVEDLFFIKKQGNACAHGEVIKASDALETIQRAFEASINYVYSKKKDDKIDSLIFDTTLLITKKPKNEPDLAQKFEQAYLEEQEQETFLNSKQGEFKNKTPKKGLIKDVKKYQNKEKNPKKQKVREKIKEAKKNLQKNVNISLKKSSKKTSKKENKKLKSRIVLLIFAIISIILIFKMMLIL